MHNLHTVLEFDRMPFLKGVLMYIDKTDNLKAVKSRSRCYQNLQDEVFHFVIHISPVELLDLNAELGNIFMNETSLATKLFQEVVFHTIKALELIPSCESMNQVTVSFRLLMLPSLPNFILNSSSELTRRSVHPSFVMYEGIVSGTSVMHKYTKSAHYLCSQSTCRGSRGYHFVRVHVAGAQETQTIRSDFTCLFCGSSLLENMPHRILADKIIVEMVDVSALNWSKKLTAFRTEALTVYLRDDLATPLELGQKVQVIGTPATLLDKGRVILEANNVIVCKNTTSLTTEQLPPSISRLLQDRQGSPWSFGMSLAYAFGMAITPPGTFHQLKFGLLLSLVSLTERDRQLHVLAVSKESVLVHRLMLYASQFTSQCAIHTVGKQLGATVTKDHHGCDVPFIEGGSLLQAYEGVCFIPSLNTYKSSLQTELIQVLEHKSVTAHVPKKLNSESGSYQLYLPVHCSVWAYCDWTIDQVIANEVLLSSFSMVFYCEVETGSYAEELIVQEQLEAVIDGSPVKENFICNQDFLQFLQCVSSVAVVLDDEAECLLQGYYVASRRARGSHNVLLPVSAVQTLTDMTKCHAKLHLRQVATEHDAVMSIYLYESAIISRTGSSTLTITPEPHFLSADISDYLGSIFDERMFSFQKHLKLFINTNAPEVTDVTAEE